MEKEKNTYAGEGRPAGASREALPLPVREGLEEAISASCEELHAAEMDV